MEEARDTVKEDEVTKYATKLQEYGISLDNDDPVLIGQKVLESSNMGGQALDLSKMPGNSYRGDLDSTKLSASNAKMNIHFEES